MIELAKQYNKNDYPIDFVRNTEPDLRFVPSGSVSFVYSHIVLQHISNELQRHFIAEFARILEPDGIAFFQIPVENCGPPRAAARVPWLQRQMPQPLKDGLKKILGVKTQGDIVTMEMNVLPDAEIASIVRSGGCGVVDQTFSNSTERGHGGTLAFFDRPEAVARIASGETHSPFLSACYVVRQHGPPASK